MKIYDSDTIVTAKQNHPELVIADAQRELNLTDEQAEILRIILLYRGINKWLYCRLKIIDLKHELKKLSKSAKTLDERNIYNKIHAEMQSICKIPRWIEWGKYHSNMHNNRREIRILGKHM